MPSFRGYFWWLYHLDFELSNVSLITCRDLRWWKCKWLWPNCCIASNFHRYRIDKSFARVLVCIVQHRVTSTTAQWSCNSVICVLVVVDVKVLIHRIDYIDNEADMNDSDDETLPGITALCQRTCPSLWLKDELCHGYHWCIVCYMYIESVSLWILFLSMISNK